MHVTAWHIPRWALPVALCGALGILGADVYLMRRHPVRARPRPIPEKIGLHVGAEGGGMRVEWERTARPVRNADHAILFIEDGTRQVRVDLTGRQLDGSSVMYWPESEQVTFRLDVFRGDQRASDSTSFGLPPDGARRRKQGRARAVVVLARPSPFERVQPEIEVTQARPATVISAPDLVNAPEPAEAAPARESRLERVISKIPLLRHLRRHPPEEETESNR